MKKRMISFVVDERLLAQIAVRAKEERKSRSQTLRDAAALYVTSADRAFTDAAHADADDKMPHNCV